MVNQTAQTSSSVFDEPAGSDGRGRPSYVIEINDLDRLEDYRLAWNLLLSATPGANFFQTLDWLACYWRHYGDEQTLRVLVVHSGDKPVGIVPLTVICERTRVGKVRVLTYPLHDWGWFFGPIGPNPAATLTAAMHYLSDQPRDWDLLDLRWVDNDRADHGRTERAMEAAGFAACEGVWNETAIVDTSGSWDDFLASRTPKFRNNLRRYEKRVAQLGEVKFERYRPLPHADRSRLPQDDPRWDFYDACEQVAASSWQSDATDGTTISDESVRVFFRESYALAVKNGMADLCLLSVDGRPIAFGYNYVHDGYALGIRFGYDKEFYKAGVGNVMYTNMLRDSFERGDQAFDMGVGSLEIKQPWLTEVVKTYRYTHYPLAAPQAQMLRLKHWWDRRAKVGRIK